ncbi:MAG: leucyl aminopeptidase [Pseudomonadota bacterium]
MKISFAKSIPAKTDILVIPVFENADFSPALQDLDAAADGAVSAAAKAQKFKGAAGKSLNLIGLPGIEAGRLLLLGAGKQSDLNTDTAEKIGGRAIAATPLTAKTIAFALDGFGGVETSADEAAAHVALGARLRSYRFDKYHTLLEADKKPALEKLVIVGAPTGAKPAFAPLDKMADGVFLTRDLVSEPANILYPESFAKRCEELQELGIKVTVLGEAQMKKLGMGSLLGVGQGSIRESKLVAMEWMGGKKTDPTVAFVGKGVTFDTGGISLKPGPGMEDMKWDMGGAGAVTGAMAALAGRKAKANVVGVIGLVENMPDGNAQRPGDVVTAMSGKTIEILNTDAEGRLVLADAIWWTQEKYKPEVVIDLATLTGAIIISLAHEHAGVFTSDDDLWTQINQAGTSSKDTVWRMPLSKAHYDMIKSPIADMKNIGGREGGSSTAAAFIGNFVKEGQSWAHIDIAGMAWNKKDSPTCPKGGSGYGVRLLNDFVAQNYEG